MIPLEVLSAVYTEIGANVELVPFEGFKSKGSSLSGPSLPFGRLEFPRLPGSEDPISSLPFFFPLLE
jgi:hypothetical protein